MKRGLVALFFIHWAVGILIVLQTTHLLTLIDDPAQIGSPAYGMFLLAAASSGFWVAWVPAAAMLGFALKRSATVRPHLWIAFGYWAVLSIAAVALEQRLLTETGLFDLQLRQWLMLPFALVGSVDVLSRPGYLKDAGLMLLLPLGLSTIVSLVLLGTKEKCSVKQ